MKKKIFSIFTMLFIFAIAAACNGKKYEVSFDLNGGTSAETIEVQKIKEGNLVTKPADPTRDGYTFAHWSLEDEEWSFAEDKVTKKMTLTATWDLSEYVVSFDTLGGAPIPEAQSVVHGQKAVEPEVVPTLEGNEFLGWYLGDNIFDFDTIITKQINLVAKWEDVSYLKTLKYYEYLDINNPVITIEVEDYGIMKLELFPNVAENTVNNFINYVLENEYNGTIFHRVIKNFMIQGGAVRRPNSPIKGDFSNNGVENNLKHYRGVISMARTNVPDSATSQFFIVDLTSSHLDGQYAGFGGLVSGFEVLDSIASVQTMYPIDRPLKDIVITSITVNLNGYEPKEVEYIK